MSGDRFGRFLEKKIFPDIRCTGKKGEKCEEKTDSNFDRMLSGGSDSFQNPLKTEAATDQYGFNTETPSDFHANDGANPYGKGKTALNPIMEPFIFAPPAVL